MRDDGGLLAAHRLLEARLLLGLEEGVVLERIAVQVAVDRVESSIDELRRFSSTWSSMTWEKNDAVSTGMRTSDSVSGRGRL